MGEGEGETGGEEEFKVVEEHHMADSVAYV